MRKNLNRNFSIYHPSLPLLKQPPKIPIHFSVERFPNGCFVLFCFVFFREKIKFKQAYGVNARFKSLQVYTVSMKKTV